MATSDEGPRVVAATVLETWMARCVLRGTTVTRVGTGVRRHDEAGGGKLVLVCGLAGALNEDLAPGSVAVPELIGLPDGTRLKCHPGWVAALVAAATDLGFTTHPGPLLTSPTLVSGAARAHWARRGYVAADMETGLLAARGWQVATVRVILDTPGRSFADDWERPTQAILRPALWSELLWLATAAPRYSLRSARIVKHALGITAGNASTQR